MLPTTRRASSLMIHLAGGRVSAGRLLVLFLLMLLISCVQQGLEL